MNASSLYAMTLFAAVVIVPGALLALPIAPAAGILSVMMLGIAEAWRGAIGRERRAARDARWAALEHAICERLAELEQTPRPVAAD